MTTFLDLARIPVNCSALPEARGEAFAATRGNLRLAVCGSCGMIRNVAFDPDLVVYDPSYDNTLHFSPLFEAFSVELADRLIESHGLHGREIVEVGSGKGEFLATLCERGPNHGLGYDPSYESPDARPDHNGAVEFVAELFNEETARGSADFVCARHVLEHIDDPLPMVRSLRDAMQRRDSVLYLEVPDTEYLMRAEDVWDLVYPHCSYFTAPSLARLVTDCGFDLLEVGTAFGGQFLYVDARPAQERDRAPNSGSAAEVDAVVDLAVRFGARFAAVVDRRRELIASLLDDERRAVLWGGGAKAVTFLNVVPGAEALDAIIDVNPRKWGRYVPGTGQKIVSPDSLVSDPPGTVIVMNPIYLEEIRSMTAALGLDTEVVAANEGERT